MDDGDAPDRFLRRFESSAEQQIRAAQERGEFDDLDGHGRPIADLDVARPPGWWASKWVETERVTAAVEALELRRKQVRREVLSAADTDAIRAIVEEFNSEVAAHNRRLDAAKLRSAGAPGSLPRADRHRVEEANVHEAIDRWYRNRRHQRERSRRSGWGLAGR